MRSIGWMLALAGVTTAVLVLGAGVSAASPSKAKPACTAGQATGTHGCVRTWVAAGCSSFVPVVKSVFGVSSVEAKRANVRGRAGRGSLLCTFQLGGDASFDYWFFNAAHQTNWPQFLAQQNETGQVTGCVPSATSDPSTATPRGNATPIAGLGSEAVAIDICPGGGYGVWNDNSITSGPAAPPTVIDQLPYTQRRVYGQATGATSSLPKLIAFMRQAVKQLP